VAWDWEQPSGVRAVAPLQKSDRGGSNSFLVLADDQARYWCKALNNGQSPRVPVNEQIVGRLGKLVGIPVCDTTLVEIPEDLAGWEFAGGRMLEPGWVHGSKAVESAVETHALDHRADDDNAVRHAGFFALFDWLAGSDPQWLYSTPDQNRYFSHDHGHYLGEPAWTIATLEQRRDGAIPLSQDRSGLSPEELLRMASVLGTITHEELRNALQGIPKEWPVSEEELEAVVAFADYRRTPVAERLTALAGGDP
jgi:hypothetical protein